MDTIPGHFKLTFESTANLEAVVQTEYARFTVLTPRLIRMEWSPQGTFEDRASQAFWTARSPCQNLPCAGRFRLIIETEALRWCTCQKRPFTADQSLWIEMKHTDVTWHYGDPDPATWVERRARWMAWMALTPLSLGLISRSAGRWWMIRRAWCSTRSAGWSRAARPRASWTCISLGYGHDYGCLRDFNRVSGAVPMIPRFVLGNWWSRYWEYSQEELTQLMQEFEAA
jgi:hypothetical protein